MLYARLLLRADDVPQRRGAVQKRSGDRPGGGRCGAWRDAWACDAAGRRGRSARFEDEVVRGSRAGIVDDDAGGAPITEIERPKVSFRDVGGMESLKEEISLKIIYPLQHAGPLQGVRQVDRRRDLDVRPAGLRQDAPGARHGRRDQGQLSCRSASPTCSTCGSAAASGTCTSCSSRRGANKPCVLFFDEVDALGGRRADMHSGSARQIINQFLAEMDGVERSNDGLLILAATNAPWHVDPAFRRPGRFDRVLFVPPPDQPARARDPADPLQGQADRQHRLRPACGEDRQLFGRGLEGRGGSGGREQAPRGDEVGRAEAAFDQGPSWRPPSRSSPRRGSGSRRRGTTRSTATRAACTTTCSSI